jgi:hypothetical protein
VKDEFIAVRVGQSDAIGEVPEPSRRQRARFSLVAAGWDHARAGSRPYGGAWQGPIFVLTNHPEDVDAVEGVTFLNCDVAEAVRIGLDAADGKNLEVSRRRSVASRSSAG